jgi:hypothetical protein
MNQPCQHTVVQNQSTKNPYIPLLAIITISSILGLIQTYAMHHLAFHMWMDTAMGYYLVLMSTMKFFDLKMFAMNFKDYDLISGMFPFYAYAYPVIELLLGAAFLNHLQPVFSNWLMIIVMSSSLFGIVLTLKKGEVKPCSCMGPALNVPLGIVSILECAVMVAMGVMNLMMSH